MRLFGKIDSGINRFDRATWLTPPFDLSLVRTSHLFTRKGFRFPDRHPRPGRMTRWPVTRLSIVMLPPVRITRDLWLIRWQSPFAGPFYVWRDGVMIDVTYSKQVRIWAEDDEDGSIVDVFVQATDTPTTVRSSRFVLRWAGLVDTVHYRIERYEDAAWVLRETIPDHGGLEYVYRSDGLDDDVTHQFRVLPVGTNRLTGTPVNLSKHAVRNPYRPNHAMAYNDGAGTLTITGVT